MFDKKLIDSNLKIWEIEKYVFEGKGGRRKMRRIRVNILEILNMGSISSRQKHEMEIR